MNFKQYQATLVAFSDRGAVEWEGVLNEQDRLITALVERGATIVGWKVVEKGVFLISPIFDFQLFAPMGAAVPQNAIRGTEVEVCFQLNMPKTTDLLDEVVERLETYAAVELIRPDINGDNHPACDFYFNYGVFVSHNPVVGELVFTGGNQGYEFAFSIEQAAVAKREVLQEGVLECIRRGYGGKSYFFITGTLNGLVPVADSIGANSLVCGNEKLICFDIS